MSGFSWRDARLAEYRNHGPAAAVSPDRPQLGDEDARAYTVAAHLTGTDGWAPYARAARAPTDPPQLHISAGSSRTGRREPTT